MILETLYLLWGNEFLIKPSQKQILKYIHNFNYFTIVVFIVLCYNLQNIQQQTSTTLEPRPPIPKCLFSFADRAPSPQYDSFWANNDRFNNQSAQAATQRNDDDDDDQKEGKINKTTLTQSQQRHNATCGGIVVSRLCAAAESRSVLLRRWI